MKFKYIAMSAALGLATLSSCSDFLDKSPDTRVYLQTVEQLRQLMVDGYSSTSIACVGELSSDNVIDNNSPSDAGVRYNRPSYAAADDQLYKWEAVTMGQDNDTPTGAWEGCYGAIAVCNAVLEKVNEFETTGQTYNGPLTQEEKDKLSAIKGEALVSRAWHHFILANLFCMPYAGPELSKAQQGIPYVTAPETTVKPHYERGTLANVYECIENDLKAGLPLINDGLYEVPKYHFNKAAANAFAARFYLYKRDYEKVVKYATDAFKGNEPATMLNDIWSNNSFYYISDIGRYNTSMQRPNVWMCFTTYTTFWRRFVSSGRYACNREAKRATVQGPGPSWENCRYQNSRTKESFAMMPCFNGYCGTAGGQEYGTYFGGNSFEQFEYTDKIAGIGYPHIVQRLFTCAELLLERAEAKIMLGQCSEGAQDIMLYWNSAYDSFCEKDKLAYAKNVVPMTEESLLSYYSKSSTPNTLPDWTTWTSQISPSFVVPEDAVPYMNCVNDIRRYETSFEGLRFFDLKRWGLTYKHTMGLHSDLYISEANSNVRALELPWESIASGLEKSRNTVQDDPATRKMTLNKNAFVYKPAE